MYGEPSMFGLVCMAALVYGSIIVFAGAVALGVGMLLQNRAFKKRPGGGADENYVEDLLHDLRRQSEPLIQAEAEFEIGRRAKPVRKPVRKPRCKPRVERKT